MGFSLLIPIILASNILLLVGQRRQSKAIRALQETVIRLITGAIREVGPVEAQEKALRKMAEQRALERKLRPSPINL